MTARVSPTDRIRIEIDELFASDRDLGQTLEDVARLGARLLLQTALEAEVTEFLGRERYGRGDRDRAGSRNGHAPAGTTCTGIQIFASQPAQPRPPRDSVAAELRNVRLGVSV